MSDNIIFISHIHEEIEIAIWLKELLNPAFASTLNIFISGDGKSIKPGDKWLPSITNALKNSVIEIVLCSPESIKRPWINFEAGAGWVRDIPVIPLCHSGMSPSKLPRPLDELQAIRATDLQGLHNLLPIIVQSIDAPYPPQIDFDPFITKVKKFEKTYLQKNIIWAFETNAVASRSELERVKSEGINIINEWNIDDDPPKFIDCHALVYVFGQTDKSQERLSKVVNSMKTLNNIITLIIFTGNRRLNDEEMKIANEYKKTVFSNMPETLLQRLAEAF